MTAASRAPSPQLRRHALREGFLAAVDLLTRRRAAEVPDGYLDDYVSLHWLEWNAGSLRVTVVGENICRQLTAGLPAAADL